MGINHEPDPVKAQEDLRRALDLLAAASAGVSGRAQVVGGCRAEALR